MSSHLWHPFAAMGLVQDREFVIVRGEGSHVWDANGREYLDATAGLWFANVGHGRKALADAAAAQMAQLASFHTFGDLANPPALQLAERVSELAPVDNGAVFFCSGGSDAVDTAGKIVRRYWSLMNEPKRRVIISRRFAYHGMNAYGTSLGGITLNAEGLGPLVDDTLAIAHDDPGALNEALDRLGPRAAAFIGEPVIGAGGVIPPPDGYWPAVAAIAKDHGILYISDEVISGFGRLGTWFGADRYGVRPDLITCAKGITSGYMPLGAVIASERVCEPFWQRTAPPFRHGYTYSGHAAACAVALANLDILESEDLLKRVQRLEKCLTTSLDTIRSTPGVSDVRSVGLLGAIELSADAIESLPTLADDVSLAARERGVITRPLRGTSLQLSPAFIIDESDLIEIVNRVAAAITDIVAGPHPVVLAD